MTLRTEARADSNEPCWKASEPCFFLCFLRPAFNAQFLKKQIKKSILKSSNGICFAANSQNFIFL
jgi:hypothetical protein